MKAKSELITNDLKYDKYFVDDINFLIEFSYVIGKSCKEEMAEFDKLLEFCDDGIELYSLFVKFCYDEYSNEMCSYVEYLERYISDLIKEFKNKYFEEE